jgi:hypothetical protein
LIKKNRIPRKNQGFKHRLNKKIIITKRRYDTPISKKIIQDDLQKTGDISFDVHMISIKVIIEAIIMSSSHNMKKICEMFMKVQDGFET